MLTDDDLGRCPSLRQGPLVQVATSAITAARSLGGGRFATVARSFTVPFVFDGMEAAFRNGEEPVAQVAALLGAAAEFLQAAHRSGFDRLGVAGPRGSGDERPVEQITGEHYGRLFEAFADNAFWDEPARLLRDRLSRNQVETGRITGAEVLDAGCGGGRYTAAWVKLGARSAVGLDISAVGLESARKRVEAAGLSGVTFQEGSVLAMPFEDSRFDVAFSNGVLHHTTNWQQGIKELVRVLKPGGLGFLYLIENPGGLFWDLIEILRLVMDGEEKATARAALGLLGIPANRVFYMLDHVMVPINIRLTPQEIEQALAAAGAVQIRRLERGTDWDRIERIHQREPFAEVKYGVGENRYIFSKGR
jgi:SAM-dependent methyltransferase